MSFDFLPRYYTFYLTGLKMTIILAFFAVIFGLVIGLVFALMKLSHFGLLRGISTAYINFIRGTPLMVQLYISYYGLPALCGSHRIGDKQRSVCGRDYTGGHTGCR